MRLVEKNANRGVLLSANTRKGGEIDLDWTKGLMAIYNTCSNHILGLPGFIGLSKVFAPRVLSFLRNTLSPAET